jgi:predicted esterase
MKESLIIYCTTIVMLTLCSEVSGQGDFETIELNRIPKTLSPEVDFLAESPLIDGLPDSNLEYLPVRKFNLVTKKENDSIVPVSYRLAYGTTFLYVYLEAEAPGFEFRDRAYQNGDGFVLTIAQAKSDGEPADEYYDLSCSAVDKPALEWARTIFWNYNVSKIFQPAGEGTKLEFKESNGKICFELLLPWQNIKPIHPWISESIGFNITVAKAMKDKSVSYYQILDEPLSALTKRNYCLLSFQLPGIVGKSQTFVSLREGHIFSGDSIHLSIVTAAEKAGNEELTIYFKTGDGERVSSVRKVFSCSPGITKNSFALLPSSLTENYGYSFNWKSLGNVSFYGNQGLTVLSEFDPETLEIRLSGCESKLSKGSFNTLQFQIIELKKRINELKVYETCASENKDLIRLKSNIAAAENGNDTLLRQVGFVRKAYQSKLDSTYQPYMVFVPENQKKAKKYPIIVYLHGSESDETSIVGFRSVIPDGFIGLGVYGRGKSNAFAADHAQDDITEAIEAVKSDYSIDTMNIFLAGFSMGGYGVFRTFYETPDKYRGLAIFSGSPYLGDRYTKGVPVPDFMDDKNLKSFKNIHVFMFHGEKDMNLPFTNAQRFADKLTHAGARVKFVSDSFAGHESPGIEVMSTFYGWIKENMK